MQRILFAVMLIVVCATFAAAGPLEDANSAYQREDYMRAAQLYRPLAEQGDAQAQRYLGRMYYKGQGVPQDYQEALNWYRKAAKQGDEMSQLDLGRMYYKGQGIPQDFIRAHMWINTALVTSKGHGRKEAMENQDYTISQMTAAQIEQAQEMARHCQETKFKECD